jgi:hypothetical protein
VIPNPRFDELLQFLEGGLTLLRTQEIEAELASSPQLRAQLAQVKALTEDLASVDPSLRGLDLVPGLRAELNRPVPALPRRGSRFAYAGPALALVAASLLAWVFIPLSSERQEFQAKGSRDTDASRWAGIDIYRPGPVRVTGTIRQDEGLAFAYRNGGPSPFGYLMIFAVGSKGRVFWFYPEWKNASENPPSIPIGSAQGAVELREWIHHDLEPGSLTLHGLFTRHPLRVSEVEAQLGHADDSWRGRDSLDHRIELKVEAQ